MSTRFQVADGLSASVRRSWLSADWPNRLVASVKCMTIQRLENDIVVDDLAAATAFFVPLGLKVLVSSAIPIRHTGICWPWLASSACAFTCPWSTR